MKLIKVYIKKNNEWLPCNPYTGEVYDKGVKVPTVDESLLPELEKWKLSMEARGLSVKFAVGDVPNTPNTPVTASSKNAQTTNPENKAVSNNQTTKNPMQEQRQLTKKLNEARYAYEILNKEIMSNREYDALYDKLQKMEQESGVILPDSPTQNVGYDVVSNLSKINHETPMLSLDKTKDANAFDSKFGNVDVTVSYKLDGLTVVLTYENGQLVQAVTRGNGITGEIVTHTVRHASGIPMQIPFKEKLVLRGEALITYAVFNKINSQIADTEAQYKNPRNLASGTVRSLDANVVKSRNLDVKIFEVITDIAPTRSERLRKVKAMGFETVPFMLVEKGKSISQAIAKVTAKAKESGIPVDGLVVAIDDVAYGESLGTTAKFPRHSMAFKWADGTAETTLRKIEWSQGRSGALTPVAIFDPVELEGTTVKRASLHNLTIAKELELGIGDRITVYKANMIIPQVDDNLTRSGFAGIPSVCPACGSDQLYVKQDNDTEVLMCGNPNCGKKNISQLSHFVSRDAMNIVGLSDGILTQLFDAGLIKTPADLYRLDYDDLICLEGMGERKVEKLLSAIENSKNPELTNYITALGIPNVGRGQAKVLAKHFGNWEEFYSNAEYGTGFSSIDGIGDVIENSIITFFEEGSTTKEIVDDLDDYIRPKECLVDTTNINSVLAGKTVVITGDVIHFSNRKELQAVIENYGGKATGSVSKSTDYLINNDITSTSTKNKKAKELGIPILTEEDFLDMIGYSY